jgi:hypothetical protein
LSVAQNNDFWGATSNITNIRCHEHNVFVGGPGYQDISRSLGRPAPYYQLNLDQERHPGHDPLTLHPQLSGHQLNMAAPAIHADWNAALRPTHVRTKLENAAIQRPEPLAPGVADHFRQHREQDQLQADQALTQLGGRQAFNQHRTQVLEANQRAAAAHEAQRQRATEEIRQHQSAISLTHPEIPKYPSRPGLAASATRQPAERSAAGPHPGLPTRKPEPLAQLSITPASALTSPEAPKRSTRPGLDATATRQPPARPATGSQPKNKFLAIESRFAHT